MKLTCAWETSNPTLLLLDSDVTFSMAFYGSWTRACVWRGEKDHLISWRMLFSSALVFSKSCFSLFFFCLQKKKNDVNLSLRLYDECPMIGLQKATYFFGLDRLLTAVITGCFFLFVCFSFENRFSPIFGVKDFLFPIIFWYYYYNTIKALVYIYYYTIFTRAEQNKRKRNFLFFSFLFSLQNRHFQIGNIHKCGLKGVMRGFHLVYIPQV